MNKQCEVVKDLIPLYIDKVCSEESCKFVEEHLAACPECAQYMRNMTGDLPVNEIEKNTAADGKHAFKKIKKKIQRRTVRAIALAVLVTILFSYGGYRVLTVTSPVQYQEDLVSFIQTSEKMTDLVYNGQGYDHFIGMSRQIKNEQENEYVLYFYFEKSLWSQMNRMGVAETPNAWDGSSGADSTAMQTGESLNRVFNAYGSYLELGDNLKIDFGHNPSYMLFAEEITNIDAVYYFVGDYMEIHQLDDEEFSEAVKEAVLLWRAEDSK